MTVAVPDGIKKINSGTFMFCENLTSVTIPSTVNIVGSFAFSGCKNLSSVTIPENITEIGSYAFSSCESIKSILIPRNVTKIEPGVIGGCKNLVTVVVDEENTVFDSRNESNAIIETSTNTLIAGCISTVIPNSIEVVGKEAFYNCDITSINIPENVISIEEGAFRLCSELTSIVIPEGVNSIGECAFQNCSELVTISIPESVTNIGSEAFYRWSWPNDDITNVTLHSNLNINHTDFPENTAFHLVLNDLNSSDLDVSIGNTYASITYNRNLTTGKYGTIMLPFAPDAESIENYIFYRLATVDGISVMFEEVEYPEANTPYLYTLRRGKEITKITGGETTITTDINNSVAVNSFKMVGSFTNQIIEPEDHASRYYYAYTAEDNRLHRILKKLTVKPFRAYFMTPASVTSGARSLRISINGVDGIKHISASEIEDNQVIYDLNGRRVSNPKNGNIYIKNGKKEIFR